MIAGNKMIMKAMQRIWRWSRSLTMGAQGVVINQDGKVLLVRHGYRKGWHFPGGGVERGESAMTALRRELREEAGIELDGRPELYGLFANFVHFPGDHIALFIVREWHQPQIPPPNREIREQGFFDPLGPPPGTAAGTGNRLAEIFAGRPVSENWR